MSTSHFLVRKSAIEKRWDPFYFQPHLVALEARVRAKAKHTLRDFTLHMAGGSTPLKSEGDQHYTTADNGIPFIRVQNLTTTGELDLQDVKHITHSTHSRLLGRSRLTGGELLVKITGVGRMAVASVVPPKVEANINQHISAIRTASIQTSEALAAYLNLDFVERLASRRATGGTRPALDYAALLSIPVIEDARIVSLMRAAISEKNKLEREALILLSKVNPELLLRLGITTAPKTVNSASIKSFTTSWRSISKARWDSIFWNPESVVYERAIEQGKFKTKNLGLLCKFSTNQWDINKEFHVDVPYLEISAINPVTGKFPSPEVIRSGEAPSRAKMLVQTGDILISTTRPGRGAIGMVGIEHAPQFVASTGFSVIREVNELIDKEYLYCLLRSEITLKQMTRRSSGGNYPAITQVELEKIRIPLPPLSIQKEIVSALNIIQIRVTELRKEALQTIDIAKAQVEKIILRD